MTLPVSQYLTELDTVLRQIVDTYLNDEEGFGVMLRYALGWVDENNAPYNHPTGKRLRPILLLLCAKAINNRWEHALPAAACVELLHNFSLIHDDIQDDSPTRHGRPTVWKIWGIANAINAGDAMFTLAYSALESLSSTASPTTLLTLWRIFNQTNIELTRGQHLDMRFEKQAHIQTDEYISMIKGKSAALLATSAQMGALITSDNPTLAQHFANFGLNIGIAFQIHDDILGIWGDPKFTGKSIATDIASRKKSLPVLFGLQHSPQMAELYKKDTFNDNDIATVVHILNTLKAEEFTRQQEFVYYQRAQEALDATQLPETNRQELQQFVEFLFQRNY